MFNKFRPDIFKKKSKKQLDDHYNNIELEKGDLPAMIIAALLTFGPIIIAVSLIYVIIGIFFGAWF